MCNGADMVTGPDNCRDRGVRIAVYLVESNVALWRKRVFVMASHPAAIVLAVFLGVIVVIAIGTLGKELVANQNAVATQSEVSRG